MVDDGRPTFLELLLNSQLPLDLVGRGLLSNWSLVATAAATRNAAACVRLLCQAGAPPTAADLRDAASRLDRDAVAALLASARPAVDASAPSVLASGGREGWSCPIHRALHEAMLVRVA